MSLTKRIHHDWILLFKFGKYEFLEDFRKNGLLFMNPSTYFSDLECDSLGIDSTVDSVRTDRFEGTDLILNRERTELVIEGPGALDSHGQPQDVKILISPQDLADH